MRAEDTKDRTTTPPTKDDGNHNNDAWLTSQLLEMEDTLRCPICHDFMRIPVSIQPCQHTFCSECIRNCFKTMLKSLKRCAQCPVCRASVSVGGSLEKSAYVANRSLQVLSQKYQTFRKRLYETLEPTAATTTTPNNGDMGTNNNHDHGSSDTSSVEQPQSPKDVVQAPPPTHTPTQTTLKKKPTTLYNALKRKQIMELCKKEGLTTNGTEKELIRRHEEFITLYNAECDSCLAARTHKDILNEVKQREQAKREESNKSFCNGSHAHSKHMERLYESRKALGILEQQQQTQSQQHRTTTQCANSSSCSENEEEEEEMDTTAPGKVQSGNPAFDHEINNNFKKLIQQGKARMLEQKRKGNATRNQSKNMDTDAADSVATGSADSGAEGSLVQGSQPLPQLLPQPQDNAATRTRRRIPKKQCSSPISDIPPIPSQQKAIMEEAVTPPSDNNCNNNNSHTKKRAPTVAVRNPYQKKSKQLKQSIQRNRRSGSGSWECHSCTFLNDKRTWATARCEMCNAPRPPLRSIHTNITTNSSQTRKPIVLELDC